MNRPRDRYHQQIIDGRHLQTLCIRNNIALPSGYDTLTHRLVVNHANPDRRHQRAS